MTAELPFAWPWETINVPGAAVMLARAFMPPEPAQALFTRLLNEVPWHQDKIRVYGKTHDVPRVHQWYGDEGSTYSWSGVHMRPLPWTPLLTDVKDRVERQIGQRFNSVLVNLYRDGNDSVGWHADDEPELGECPCIASVSLGAVRDFVIRPKEKAKRPAETVKIELPHGSLLFMYGYTQANCEHSLPKRKGVGPRINLTFRRVGSR